MGRRSCLLLVLAVLCSLFVTAPASVGAEATPRWVDLDTRVRPPTASDGMLAYDEARHELLLYGGVGSDGPVGTWVMRGDDWTRLQPETEPAPRYGSAMVYDPVRQEIVLFGGWGAVPRPQGGNSTNNETWIWNGENWRLATPEHSPPSRAFAAAGFDRARGELVLYGGITGDGTGSATIFGDTWTWNGTDWTQRTPENSPPRRHSVGSAYDPVRGEFVIFGGARDVADMAGPPDPCELRDPISNSCVVNIPTSQPRPSGVVADTWVWDGTNWSQRAPQQAPRERMNPKMAWDPATGNVLLFGGVHPQGGATTDTWLWNGVTWTELQPPQHPSHRFGIPLATDPDARRVVGFGGHQVTNYARDTWAWDGATWSLLDHPPTPEPRYFPAYAYDAERGHAVVFGGDGHRRHGDTWIYDDGWHQMTPAVSPPARSAATAAFDDARNEVVLFGGHSPQDRSDTWLWNGSRWREVTPASSPSPRRHAAMAYDSARNEAVLFGGSHIPTRDECPVTCDSVQELGDTWTWDGTNWTQEQPATSPPPLNEAVMTFDEARDEVVLFGGLDGTNTFSGETWTWNGTTWTHEQPATSPGPRADAQLAYDPLLEAVVMFSGLRSGNSGADLWMWDGTNWSELPADGAPRGRRGGVFVFDPEMRGTLLFGGTGGGPRDDTWLLQLAGADPEPTETATATPSDTPTPATSRSEITFTDASRTAGQHSDRTAFEARLTDDTGDPVAGETVVFELTGAGSTRRFEAISGDAGFARVFPVLEESPGAYLLTARYAGSTSRDPAADTTTFVVEKEDTDARLGVDGKGGSRTLSARLSDFDDPTVPIAGAELRFFADGEPIGSATTGPNGSASLQPPSGYRSGSHLYEVRFSGNDRYRASAAKRQT